MEEWDWRAIRWYYEACRSVCKTCEHFNLPARAWRTAAAHGLAPQHEPPKLNPSEKRVAIESLLADGHSQAAIGVELGLSKATVSYHARRLGLPVHDEFGRRYDWREIQRAHDSGMRAFECCRHFGFSKATWSKAVAAGRIKPRSHLIPLDQLLVKGRRTGRGHLKARLIAAGFKDDRCEECGLVQWRGAPIGLQLHHRNGDKTDNRLSNLQILCPNCHAQTDTWGGRNGHRKPNRHLTLVPPPDDEDSAESA